MTNLAVIPARGGSVEIPRKNVSLLRGKPLIAYVIEATQLATRVDQIVVSTDDDEIQHIAESYGVRVVRRGPDLCTPHATLDAVVHEAVVELERQNRETYDLVLTIQPTSPLISGHTIDAVIDKANEEDADAVLTVRDATHLSWIEGDTPGTYQPNYTTRLNRQYLPKVLRETGAIVVSKRSCLTPTSRFGQHVVPFMVDDVESVDIDSRLDWMLCEKILDMLRIVFVVTGSPQTGTGHVNRCLTLAQWQVAHQLTFLCLPGCELAYEMIRTKHFNSYKLDEQNWVDQVLSHKPHIVVNDMLDTDASYIRCLKDAGVFVVNFEDEGSGTGLADLVINALYEGDPDRPNFYHGKDYYCLRTEFRVGPPYQIRPDVGHILLTFGGTDPSNLTHKTLLAIDELCAERQIQITVVIGPGYARRSALEDVVSRCRSRCRVVDNVTVMSRYMREADICFTSCGRTVYEVAAVGVPTIAMAQNDRETRHTFISPANGICYLGRGSQVGERQIQEALRQMVDSPLLRRVMNAAMSSHELSGGARNVSKIIFDHYQRFTERNPCYKSTSARSGRGTGRTSSLKPESTTRDLSNVLT